MTTLSTLHATPCQHKFDPLRQPSSVVLRDVVVLTSPSDVRIVLVPSEENNISGITRPKVIAPDSVYQEACTHIGSIQTFQRTQTMIERTCSLMGVTIGTLGLLVLADPSQSIPQRIGTAVFAGVVSLVTALYVPEKLKTETPSDGDQQIFWDFFRKLSTQSLPLANDIRVEPEESGPNLFASASGESALQDEELLTQSISSRTPPRHVSLSPVVIVLPRKTLNLLQAFLLEKYQWRMQGARPYAVADTYDVQSLVLDDGRLSPKVLNILYDHFREDEI